MYFHTPGGTQGRDCTLKSCSIITPECSRCPKDSKKALLQCLCHSGAALVREQVQEAKLAITVNHGKDVPHFGIPLTYILNEVTSPNNSRARWQGEQLACPRPSGPASCQLAFKALASVFGTVLSHGGPVEILAEQVVQLLSSYMTVL